MKKPGSKRTSFDFSFNKKLPGGGSSKNNQTLNSNDVPGISKNYKLFKGVSNNVYQDSLNFQSQDSIQDHNAVRKH